MLVSIRARPLMLLTQRKFKRHRGACGTSSFSSCRMDLNHWLPESSHSSPAHTRHSLVRSTATQPQLTPEKCLHASHQPEAFTYVILLN